MRSRSARTSVALAVATLATAIACAARTPHESAIASPQASVDSIAVQLTDLELRRIALRATETAQTPSSRDVEQQIAQLQEQLRALPSHGSAERTVAQRVLAALDARDVALTARLREMRTMYTDTYPVVRDLAREEQLVNARRTELRAIGDGRDGVR